jgi:hypothetical protein
MCLADKREVPESVVDSLGELMAFERAMHEVGATWKPAASTGPQDPGWAEYARYTETLAKIARQQRKENDEDELPSAMSELIMAPVARPKRKKK